MNILIATFSFPAQSKGVYDGKFVFSEAIAYAEAGAKVRVLTPYFQGAETVEKIAHNITVFRFQYFFPKNLQVLKVAGSPIYRQRSFLAWCQIPFFCFFFCLTILRHALWADIIHAQWTIAAFLSLPSKWLLKKRIVVTARGTDIRRFPKWLNKFIHYQVDAAIDCFGPQPWNRLYRGTFPGRFIRLPLLVHLENPSEMPPDMLQEIRGKRAPFIMIYVGRFDRFKLDYDKLPMLNLVHVCMRLKELGLSFHVFYIGDGDESIREDLTRLVMKYQLHGDVTLLGKKMNPMAYMQFCELGIGGIALNAVSQEFTILGKPQVLVDLAENRDTPWKNGTNALFVRPDDPKDLTDQLTWAISHREGLKRIGINAREDMKTYIVDGAVGGKIYLDKFNGLIHRVPV